MLTLEIKITNHQNQNSTSMKKIATIISLVTILISIHATAQIVPNGTMESWNNVGGLYEEPASWTSPNELTFLYFTPCTKDTDAVDGQYAARLQSYFLQPFSLNVPGAIGTGLIDATTQSFTGGFPLNGNNPAALIGYFKYAPVGSDSALIFSALFKWNTSTNKRDTLAIAYLKLRTLLLSLLLQRKMLQAPRSAA